MKKGAGTPPFTQIGFIAQSHGLKGGLRIVFEDSFVHTAENLELVYLRSERGDYFPARIAEIQRQEKGNNFLFFVHFDHIADKTAADSLRNRAVYLRTEEAEMLSEESGDDVQSVVHFDVYDHKNEYYGVITDVLEHPAQDVLVIAGKNGEVLVPAVDFYVLRIDEEQEAVFCQNLNLLEDI